MIRKFFLTHNKSFRWHLGDYEKHNFFPFEGLWEEKLWFLRWVVCPLKTGLYKLNGRSVRRHAGPHTPAGQTTHPSTHTKIKVSPLTGLQMEKNYVFRNPLPRCYLKLLLCLKKNFLITLNCPVSNMSLFRNLTNSINVFVPQSQIHSLTFSLAFLKDYRTYLVQ